MCAVYGQYVIGCILDGPDPDKLEQITTGAFDPIYSKLRDQSPNVRATAAWTLGRICEIVPECINADTTLPKLMNGFLCVLDDLPTIASHVCWGIHNLADCCEVDDDAETSPLSPYFQTLVEKLFTITERKDAEGTNLVSAAYETINLLIQVLNNVRSQHTPLIGRGKLYVYVYLFLYRVLPRICMV